MEKKGPDGVSVIISSVGIAILDACFSAGITVRPSWATAEAPCFLFPIRGLFHRLHLCTKTAMHWLNGNGKTHVLAALGPLCQVQLALVDWWASAHPNNAETDASQGPGRARTKLFSRLVAPYLDTGSRFQACRWGRKPGPRWSYLHPLTRYPGNMADICRAALVGVIQWHRMEGRAGGSPGCATMRHHVGVTKELWPPVKLFARPSVPIGGRP